MKSLNAYLDEYAESHQNLTNVRLHSICVPLIMWSLVGFLHTWPLGFFDLRVSHPFVFLALIYYGLYKNWRVWFLMAVLSVLMLFSFEFVPNLRRCL